MKSHRIAALRVALTLLATLAGSGPTFATQPLAPCEEGRDGAGIAGARCGTLTVFENRAAGSGRTLDLNVLVLAATDPAARKEDPLFLLAGGPGQGAASMAGFANFFLGAVRTTRDVVLVDQRGTGASNPLACPPPASPDGYFGHIFDPEATRACHALASEHADPRYYTTANHADDLDDVRTWLGYDRINLWGLSYGTRASLVYLRRHSQHARTAILEGATPMDQRSPLSYALDAQSALDALLSECEADTACAQAFPHVRHQFRVLVDRLRRGPVTVTIQAAVENAPADGEEIATTPVEVRYGLGDFGYTVRGMLYNNALALQLPAMIATAHESGDFAPFAQAYYRRAYGLGQGLANGLYLSVLCGEEVPFIEESQLPSATDGTFLGDYLVRDYQAACAAWPHDTVPVSYNDPVRVDTPVLLLSGSRDPVTPPLWADRAAETLPNSLHLTVARQGHGVVARDGTCMIGLVRQFLDEGSAAKLDPACIEELPAPQFPAANGG